MIQVWSRGAVLGTKLVLPQLVLLNVLCDGVSQIGGDLRVRHQVMQREDGVRDDVRVVVEAVHPAVVGLRRVLLVEDVGEVPLPSDHFDLVGHEALVEAHAHVAFQKMVTLVGEGDVCWEEAQGQSQLCVQALFDVGLGEALQRGQTGPERRDPSDLAAQLDLFGAGIKSVFDALAANAGCDKLCNLVDVVSPVGVYQPSVQGSVLAGFETLGESFQIFGELCTQLGVICQSVAVQIQTKMPPLLMSALARMDTSHPSG